jgi:hypothetical protein
VDLGELRLGSYGYQRLDTVLEFLTAFKSTYDGLTVFGGLGRDSADSFLQLGRHELDEMLSEYLKDDQHIILQRVELSSPGFWEFLGVLNPLEVIRRYLEDRHRRRQDRTYREAAEQRQLELENLLLENEFYRQRLAILREQGATDAEIAQIVERLVYEPAERLDHVAARGVITSWELRILES